MAQACHQPSFQAFARERIHTDKLDVFSAVFFRVNMLQYINPVKGHLLITQNALSPHFLILLNSLPGPVG